MIQIFKQDPEVSRADFLKKSISAAALASVPFAFYQCVTTATGQKAMILLPESEEIAMGDAAFTEILGQEKMSTRSNWVSMIKRCGNRVSSVSHRPDYQWRFELINSPTVNAFCVPGGKVAYYEGIMPYCQDEAGVAIIMGHEVAHATSRHGAQRISQSMALELGMGIVGGALFSDSKHHDTIMAGLGLGAAVGVMLPYSREHEYEADALGLEYMARAGYDPEAGIEFWERFSELDKGAGTDFLSTHPLSGKRVDKMKDALPTMRKLYNAAPNRYGNGEKI
ncbi:MAG: M48 family metallopeptidase [Leptospiraceae bacterium]|nr:M48 family metallopeptidase [Leptospiraceae bacterium]MCB1201438.1 M48 family metallopeptidase [Leptospiraceae bacterium]